MEEEAGDEVTEAESVTTTDAECDATQVCRETMLDNCAEKKKRREKSNEELRLAADTFPIAHGHCVSVACGLSYLMNQLFGSVFCMR